MGRRRVKLFLPLQVLAQVLGRGMARRAPARCGVWEAGRISSLPEFSPRSCELAPRDRQTQLSGSFLENFIEGATLPRHCASHGTYRVPQFPHSTGGREGRKKGGRRAFTHQMARPRRHSHSRRARTQWTRWICSFRLPYGPTGVPCGPPTRHGGTLVVVWNPAASPHVLRARFNSVPRTPRQPDAGQEATL